MAYGECLRICLNHFGRRKYLLLKCTHHLAYSVWAVDLFLEDIVVEGKDIGIVWGGLGIVEELVAKN